MVELVFGRNSRLDVELSGIIGYMVVLCFTAYALSFSFFSCQQHMQYPEVVRSMIELVIRFRTVTCMILHCSASTIGAVCAAADIIAS